MKHLLLAVFFVVSWTAKWSEITACKETPTIDPYSGEARQIFTQSAVACFSQHSKDMTKSFKTKKEAQEFIDNAPKNSAGFWLANGPAVCENFKIRRVE